MSQPSPRHPNTTYMLTRRTSQRLMRLLPRGDKLRQLVRYAIFKAAAAHSVEIHGFCCMSTHLHVLATDKLGNIPDFTHDVHELIARAANSLHGVKGELWDGRPTNYLALEGADTALRYFTYLLLNPVKALLVKSCTDWPGAITPPSQACKTGKVKRPDTAFFRRSKLPEVVDFELTIPPALAHLAPKAFRKQLSASVSHAEQRVHAHAKGKGLRFLGVRRLLKRDRFSAPSKSGERSGERVPTIADSDPDRRRHRIELLQQFRQQYREAREQWLAGVTEVLFPAGTFKMRGYPGVVVGVDVATT